MVSKSISAIEFERIPREVPIGEEGGGVSNVATDSEDNFLASHNLY